MLLSRVGQTADDMISEFRGQKPAPNRQSGRSEDFSVEDGDVVIAAITSCTNTSNPSVLIGAGLLARNALAKGLKVKPWVKTSLAPGSQVVKDYLEKAGLQGLSGRPWLQHRWFRMYDLHWQFRSVAGNGGERS